MRHLEKKSRLESWKDEEDIAKTKLEGKMVLDAGTGKSSA